MKHILFINDLSKLDIKKDSTILMALTLKQMDQEVYLLFEEDFGISSCGQLSFKLYDFKGSLAEDGIYIKDFSRTSSQILNIDQKYCLHMRIDPPFDTKYLRYLWMLRFIKSKGVKVTNDPDGILLFNEKLYPLEDSNSIPSLITEAGREFELFLDEMLKQNYDSLIMKPMDLYQGLGVEKIEIKNSSKESLLSQFNKKTVDCKGPIMVQPFIEKVSDGEIRSLYFKGKELGSILKVPKSGEFLANIARGASFEKYELSKHQKELCEKICIDLANFGVEFIAFDILGDAISEVNITCPGLLVEVSKAYQKNLAELMFL